VCIGYFLKGCVWKVGICIGNKAKQVQFQRVV
jgi:hypothetical protein